MITNTIKNISIAFLFISSNLVLADNLKNNLPIQELQRFTNVIDHIKNYYVNPVSDAELFKYAINGMLAGLDPHSAYLDLEEFDDLKISTTGKFGGLGIEVTLEDGFIKVMAPIDDTPAYKANIQSGDLIIRLDATPVKGLTLKEAVEKMRGKPGSKIELTIVREGEDKPLKQVITRDLINVKSVKGKIIEPDYAYLRISNFQSDTGTELKKFLNKLIKENKRDLRGMVLDLRNNPGGIMDACVQAADLFLDKSKLHYDGIIVYTKGRLEGNEIKEIAHNGDLLNKAPIVVLINAGSASAAEILAGALQDHNRAIIMGDNSFGKGSVQTVLPLKNDRGLKLTTALYYTPSGRSIQAKGIVPDIKLEKFNISKPDTENNLILKEADLQRHLESTKSSKEVNTNFDIKNNDGLLYEDYALYQAMVILKSLNIII